MTKPHKGQFKKSIAQQQQYKDFIANCSGRYEGTVPSTNDLLVGSDEYKEHIDSPISAGEEIKRTPIRYQIWDWLKKNIVPTIIGAIVVAIGTTVIAHKVKIAVIQQRIDYLENQIQTMQSDNATKEYLAFQLDSIKMEFSNEIALKGNDIDWRLKNIEQWIESMDKQSP